VTAAIATVNPKSHDRATMMTTTMTIVMTTMPRRAVGRTTRLAPAVPRAPRRVARASAGVVDAVVAVAAVAAEARLASPAASPVSAPQSP
jgi:hypothetical protein